MGMDHAYTSLGWKLDAKDRNCLSSSSVHEATSATSSIFLVKVQPRSQGPLYTDPGNEVGKGQVLRWCIGSVVFPECGQQTNKQTGVISSQFATHYNSSDLCVIFSVENKEVQGQKQFSQIEKCVCVGGPGFLTRPLLFGETMY